MPSEALSALSPIDGRYFAETQSLRAFFSENALIKLRVKVEIDYLLALSSQLTLVEGYVPDDLKSLQELSKSFSSEDAQTIKNYESKTHHDVKAVELFLRERAALALVPWIHWGITSEDINLTAYALALKDSRDLILIPALEKVSQKVEQIAKLNSSIVMLARTHGQPAVPTTLGKEFAVFAHRLKKQIKIIKEHVFEAKLTGAVGNFNAHVQGAPDVDWISFSRNFINAYGLNANLLTTQLLPYDNWIHYFESLRLINSIFINLAQDIWRYVSDGYLKQKVIESEVGSSTMPQKVNPIDFENGEGNLEISNAFFELFSRELAISRLQRDLSDSTIRRNFGVALGHSLLAYKHLALGLEKLDPNEEKLHADVDAHWEIIAEGIQTILRKAGVMDGYERVKVLTRGHKVSRKTFLIWVEQLPVDEKVKKELYQLEPKNYMGLSAELVNLL